MRKRSQRQINRELGGLKDGNLKLPEYEKPFNEMLDSLIEKREILIEVKKGYEKIQNAYDRDAVNRLSILFDKVRHLKHPPSTRSVDIEILTILYGFRFFAQTLKLLKDRNISDELEHLHELYSNLVTCSLYIHESYKSNAKRGVIYTEQALHLGLHLLHVAQVAKGLSLEKVTVNQEGLIKFDGQLRGMRISPIRYIIHSFVSGGLDDDQVVEDLLEEKLVAFFNSELSLELSDSYV